MSSSFHASVLCARTVLAALGVAGLLSAAAAADPVADFYAKNQVKLVTGGTAGGGYDLYLRTLSEFFGRHLPGNPNVIVEIRTGAGGLNAVNYVYNAAPKDGTHLTMPYNIHPTFQLLRPQGLKFDTQKLVWLGNMAELNSVIALMSDVGVRTIEDAKNKETIIGASSKGSQTYIVPALFNRLVGTRFKIVLGYDGTSPLTLAMERGEIHGRAGSWYIWVASRPDWIRDGKLALLAQDGLERNPDLPNVPLYEDLVTSAEDKRIMRFMSYPVATSRALAAAPGVPAERIDALRKGFMATLKDPDFLAAAKKRSMDITAKDHRYVESVIAEMFATPPDLIERMKAMFEWK